MKITFSFQTYDRGEIAEEDIAEIIYQLLTYGAKESLFCKKGEGENEDSQLRMSLQAAAVKNQLILNGSFYSVKPLKKLKRELKRNLSEKLDLYHGEITAAETKGEEKQISIRIQREMRYCGNRRGVLCQNRKHFKTLRRCVKQFGGSMQISENENRLKIETILAGRNNSTETNVSCLEIQL